MDKLRNVTALSGVLAVCIMALVLLSGRATVNFTHTPVIAQISEDRYYKIIDDGSIIHVHLSTSIGPPEVYRTLVHVLLTSDRNTINIYLNGYGGRSDSALMISNAMLKSKSHVVTVMTGNVASAHAIIAANGDLRSLSPFFEMMFHVAAILDRSTGENITPFKYCKKFMGKKDRGQDYYKKCIDAMKAHETAAHLSSMIKVYRGLNREQIELYMSGHDVYVPVWKFLMESAKKGRK